jgi:hypothetical protein
VLASASARRTPMQLCAYLVALGCSLTALACSGNAQNVCRRDPISGVQNCGDVGGGYEEAAIVGGTAAVLWAAKGCTINGCEPPFVCSAAKLCERLACGETSDCPPGYMCSASDQRCR